MLDSTFELITEAASNPHMVFCFCNLIIAILLVGTSKPSSSYIEESPKVGRNIISKTSVSLCENVVSKRVEAGELSSVNITMVDNVEMGPHDDEEEEEEFDDDDDDLKRRVEEFIEKINKGWRAEKVKTYVNYLGH